MTEDQIENIESLLKNHYGATKVVVDTEFVFVYGGESEGLQMGLKSLLTQYKVELETFDSVQNKYTFRLLDRDTP